LFDNVEFRRATLIAFEQIGDLVSSNDTDFNRKVLEIIEPVWARWRALPAFSLVALEFRTAIAILSGSWGLVKVLPWTTDQDIAAATRDIRRVIGKAHQDQQTARRGALAEWLELHDFTREEIARAVWHRTRGLRRPSRAAALARSEAREHELMRRFLDRGANYREADRRTVRALRGSEAPGIAAVRKAIGRARQEARALQQALTSPKTSDPLASAVADILRHDYLAGDESQTSGPAGALWSALGLGPLLFGR
jgi:hypothetical protein